MMKKILPLIIPIFACGLIFIGVSIYFLDKIYPNIAVKGISVSYLTAEEAHNKLQQSIPTPTEITLTHEEETFVLPLSDIDFAYDIDQSTQDALLIGRSGHIFTDLKTAFTTFFTGVNLPIRIQTNEEKLNTYLATIAGQIAIESVTPSARLVNGKIQIETGKKGQDLNSEKLKEIIYTSLREQSTTPIKITLVDVDPTLSEAETEVFRARAEHLIGKSIAVTSNDITITILDKDLLTFLWPKGGYDQKAINEKITLIENQVNREPQSAKFVFEEGRVKEFAPSKDGLEIKKRELSEKLTQSMSDLEISDQKQIAFEAPVSSTPPQVTNAEVNNLGIKERIGRGTSRFRGSIPSRIHNVALATSRINGALIAPGETFSFNNALGDVSKLTGYKEAYIIQNGKTVLGDGGGVCQVSTTLFRAALNAGLPITERRAHAYRVYYYEQDSSPGLDATVYSPTTDFKIKNDTPAHILIQATADTKNLTVTFELYGTSDGRVATTTKPVITDSIDPGDDVYTDDPTLPAGQIKQTEHKAFGAKVSFDYSVKRGEETIYTKKFISNYRPWQNVFLRGTGPVQ